MRGNSEQRPELERYSLCDISAYFDESGLLQAGSAREVLIDGGSRFASFRNSPDHERLPSAHIASSENSWHRTHVILRCDIASSIQVYAQLFEHAVFHRPQKAQREQH